jgi:hypothetical protein
MISEANIFDNLNTKVHICDTIGNTIICKHSTCRPNTIENIVYLTKIIGVERIKENTCISICGRIFALMQTLALGLQSKQKMRQKELA